MPDLTDAELAIIEAHVEADQHWGATEQDWTARELHHDRSVLLAALRTARQQLADANQRIEELEDAADLGSEYALKLHAAEAENQRLRALAEDLASHGLRADLNPTMNFDTDTVGMYTQFERYLRRIDESIRARATAALRDAANGEAGNE